MLTPTFVCAQFSHRFEISAEKTFSSQFDNIRFFEKSISYNRTGGGVASGIKYNFRSIPMGLFLGYEDSKYTNYSLKSDLDLLGLTNKLKIKNIDLDVQYLFFRQSTFKPYISIGMNFNSIDYFVVGLKYNHIIEASSNEFIEIDEIMYNPIHSNFNALGLKLGAGLNVQLSDKFGIAGSVKLRYIPQNQTDWLGNLTTYTASIGVYYRLFKRKNNISSL